MPIRRPRDSARLQLHPSGRVAECRTPVGSMGSRSLRSSSRSGLNGLMTTTLAIGGFPRWTESSAHISTAPGGRHPVAPHRSAGHAPPPYRLMSRRTWYRRSVGARPCCTPQCECCELQLQLLVGRRPAPLPIEICTAGQGRTRRSVPGRDRGAVRDTAALRGCGRPGLPWRFRRTAVRPFERT